jgi:hypothetical protein
MGNHRAGLAVTVPVSPRRRQQYLEARAMAEEYRIRREIIELFTAILDEDGEIPSEAHTDIIATNLVDALDEYVRKGGQR